MREKTAVLNKIEENADGPSVRPCQHFRIQKSVAGVDGIARETGNEYLMNLFV